MDHEDVPARSTARGAIQTEASAVHNVMPGTSRSAQRDSMAYAVRTTMALAMNVTRTPVIADPARSRQESECGGGAGHQIQDTNAAATTPAAKGPHLATAGDSGLRSGSSAFAGGTESPYDS